MQLLEDSFEVETGILQFATALDSSNLDEIQVFLDKAVNARYSCCIQSCFTYAPCFISYCSFFITYSSSESFKEGGGGVAYTILGLE